eukprot:183408-Pleurochrysis_carterae.AAC.1
MRLHAATKRLLGKPPLPLQAADQSICTRAGWSSKSASQQDPSHVRNEGGCELLLREALSHRLPRLARDALARNRGVWRVEQRCQGLGVLVGGGREHAGAPGVDNVQRRAAARVRDRGHAGGLRQNIGVIAPLLSEG